MLIASTALLLTLAHSALADAWPPQPFFTDKLITPDPVTPKRPLHEKGALDEKGAASNNSATPLTGNRPIQLSPAEAIWIDSKKTISVAFDENWPPYSYRSEKGELTGIAVEITRRLAARLGLQLELRSNDQWANLLQQTIDGDIDMVGTLYALPERRQWFSFTRPYLSASSYVIVRQENRERFEKLSSLAGQKVALVEENVEAQIALQQIPNIIPVYVDTQATALKKVSTGQAAATIADLASSNQTILQQGLINLAFTEDLSPLLDDQKIRFAVSKQQPILAALFDKALETLSVSELNRIYGYWNIPQSTRPAAGYLSLEDTLTEQESNWLRKHPVIRLGVDSSFAPYEYLDNQQGYSGLCADYIKLLSQQLNIRFEITPLAARPALLNAIDARQQDMLGCSPAQYSASAKRAQAIDYTEAFISRPLVIVTGEDIGFVGDAYNLRDKSVAVQRGYSAQNYLQAMHPELPLKLFDDAKTALTAVSTGEVFAYVGDMAVANRLMRRYGMDNLKISGQLARDLQLSIGVRDDWPELTAILNKTLAAISVAEQDAIHQKWITTPLGQSVDRSLLWTMGALIGLILLGVLAWNRALRHQIRQRTELLLRQESYDRLTGLPNRLLAMDRFTQLMKDSDHHRNQVAVLLIHIDRLKDITDVLGYDTSDQIVAEIALRLLVVAGKDNTLAKLDSTEFVLLHRSSGTNDMIDRAEKIQAAVREDLSCTDQPLQVTASIGIAVYPDNASHTLDLLRHAYSAMQQAKNNGGDSFSFFTDSLNRNVARRVQIEQHMYRAVKNQRFDVHYQPVIEVKTGKVVGVEALLRWRHSELGQISPEEFIPIAENNGLIRPLGQFVLRQAIMDIATVEQSLRIELKVAVNLSPAQLHDESFIVDLKNLLKELQFPPQKVELEITEGILIESESNIANTLSRLHATGVSLSMDDFGTGYSSLFYLRKYPFDTLKIDREFIQDIQQGQPQNSLVSAATAMGQGLGLNVIAEGVETEQQLQHLQAIDCHYCQGYYFSEPLPYVELLRFLGQHQDRLQTAKIS